MNELQKEIIQYYFEEEVSCGYFGYWLSLKSISEAFELPPKDLHPAIMELVEQQILFEKPKNEHYPYPKVYRRFLGLVEQDHLAERDKYLITDMRQFDIDRAWGLEWWFYEEVFPRLQTDQPPDQNIPILKTQIERALKWYRDEVLAKPDAPFQEEPLRRPKLTI